MLVWINPWGRRYRAAIGPPGPWTRGSRLLAVALALAATVPAWPSIQPGDPVADEMLSPGEVGVIIPVVLVFPVAWALLGRSRLVGRRVGAGLAGCVAAWSLGTITLASYATPPTVDDALRWYLAVTGGLVGAAALLEWFRRPGSAATPEQPPRRGGLRWAAGVAVWVIGWGATAAVPVVDGGMVPPRDALLPLPRTMAVVGEEATCAPAPPGGRYCVRRFIVAASDGVEVRDLARRLGQHLERTKGWRLTWYDFSLDPDVECRREGWLANPYYLCANLRADEQRSTVEVQLAYSNPHDPIYN